MLYQKMTFEILHFSNKKTNKMEKNLTGSNTSDETPGAVYIGLMYVNSSRNSKTNTYNTTCRCIHY